MYLCNPRLFISIKLKKRGKKRKLQKGLSQNRFNYITKSHNFKDISLPVKKQLYKLLLYFS